MNNKANEQQGVMANNKAQGTKQNSKAQWRAARRK
jgi:hypothetical protein